MKAGSALVLITVVVLAGATYFVLPRQDKDAPEVEGTSAAGGDPIEASESESTRRNTGISQEEAQAERERWLELQEERSRLAVEAELTLETLRYRMANVGVNPQALDSYEREARTTYQLTSWGQLGGCVKMFGMQIEPFRYAAATLTKSYDASVTESGRTIKVGPMTCVEILWSSTSYNQRNFCERAQSDFDRYDAQLLETHSECAEFARRVGLYADQVQEILQLP